MRWFIVIEEQPIEGFPNLFIEGEIIGYENGEGREMPAPGHEASAISRDQLLAHPGGQAALERWESADDSVYRAFRLADLNRIDAEDERFAAMSDGERWDWLAARHGRERVEHDMGPRPTGPRPTGLRHLKAV
jgi:hypothetical protein